MLGGGAEVFEREKGGMLWGYMGVLKFEGGGILGKVQSFRYHQCLSYVIAHFTYYRRHKLVLMRQSSLDQNLASWLEKTVAGSIEIMLLWHLSQHRSDFAVIRLFCPSLV